MKILIITDAWLPQTNGVVRTLLATQKELVALGHQVEVFHPRDNRWLTVSMPTYREIKLDFLSYRRMKKFFKTHPADAVHIATEGPLGLCAVLICLAQRKPFSTAYHTRFPEYVCARVPHFLPSAVARGIENLTYAALRRFHNVGIRTLVPTQTMFDLLKVHGFTKVALWSRGVDTDAFYPGEKDYSAYCELKRPILLYVGRISVEKNLKDFLALSTTGTKVLIGSGPDLKTLSKAYPDSVFLGRKEGNDLANAFAAADVFVFPSKTDTFGLVLLEACAAGLRVAAYNVSGPADVFNEPEAAHFAALDADLQRAVDRALILSDRPERARAFAEKHSWRRVTEQFVNGLKNQT
ncbi:MAG: glycosyltransferase family 1 protein [Proteobacteria bacterium]|nr:glycosyltransferase family 1 protein [Pseudomonadota bacterium]